MPTAPLLLTPDARRTANRLLDVLQRERIADGAAVTQPSVLGPGGIDAHSELIERAKGALMLHYGIDSHQAFAVLIGWARTSRAPVPHHRPRIAARDLRGQSADRGPTTGVGAMGRGAASGQRSWPRATLDGTGPASGHMRLRALDECGNGGVQGRGTHAGRAPAPHHHQLHVAPGHTFRRRPILMTAGHTACLE